jgi:invasion protein IalB
MKAFFESGTWVGVLAILALIGVSVAAAYLTQKPVSHAVRLPLVKNVDVPPGFVGKQSFGLWTLMCQNFQGETPEAPTKRLCRTNARMTVAGPNNTKVLAAGFNIVMMSNQSGPGVLFQLPPAAAAADAAHFAIDKNTSFRAPVKCDARQCMVQGALPPEAIDQLRTGHTLSLVYTVKDRAQQERKIRVDQLLHGFRQSYDAMTRAMTS